MSSKIVKKILSVSLCALMLGGTAVILPAAVPGGASCITAYAANSETPASSFEYEENNKGGITITKFKGSEKNVIIPSKIKSKPVTSIGDRAFYGCTGITSITIPDTVTSIGEYAFFECTDIISIKLGNSVKSLGKEAFFYCSSLESINIPHSVTSIGYGMFWGCTSLTDLTIPDSVKEIGEWAFAFCLGLKSMIIPPSVTAIGKDAFYDCYDLAEITIPSSVKTIGEYAFYECESLNNVTIPYGVTNIYDYTFTGCTGLKSVTIPKSVTSISNYSFYEITGITIYGTKGSAAEEYANKKGYTFKTAYLKNLSYIESDSVELSESVILTANASGGKAPYTYTYRCKKSDATLWKYLAANTNNITLSYKPASTGTYDIQVIVKDADGKTSTKGFKLTVKAALTNNSAISAASTTVGTAVKLTAKASGGKSPYTYTYRCKKSDATSWKYLAANTTNTTLSYKPASAGTYDIQVIVKDADGKTSTKGFKLTVKAAFTNTSTISATSITAGKSVTLTAKATGGKTPYTYTFRCKKIDAASWKYLAANTTTATLSYKPASAGTYDVQVIVKDADGKTVTKGFKLTVK